MKIRQIALTAMLALALIGVSQSRAAVWDFDVDGTETWLGYVNSTVWSGAYGFADLRSSFTDPGTIKLQSNVLAQDNDPGGWAGATMELNSYQEVVGAVGDTASFDFYTVANELAAQGYTAIGFMKVLDPGPGWATTQFETFALTPGVQGNLSLTVLPTIAPDPRIQAGFAITGLSDFSGSATADLAVTVIPEPATLGLLGLAGAGLFIRRRLLS